MKIKFQKISEDATTPCYAHHGDAGMDIFSAEETSLKPNERKVVRTGLKMELSEGYVFLIWDKSGVATKNGIKTIGGVVEHNYRGEILIALINLSDTIFEIKKGQKIAQALIQKVESAEIEEVETVNQTNRGDGGFGSTGLFSKNSK